MVKFYNKKYKDQIYKIDQKIILSFKNICIKKSNKKLADKYFKLFRINGVINKNVYRLNLPKSYKRIHSIFYIALLELYCRRKRIMLSDSININGKKEQKINQVLNIKIIKKKRIYLIR